MSTPTRRLSRIGGEQGIALVTTLLVIMLMSALLIGLTTTVMHDQRYRSIDKDRFKAFYGAQAGLEKLTSGLGDLFAVSLTPTDAQIAALKDSTPDIPDVTFVTDGTGAYGVTAGASSNGTISTGPYAGLIALKKTYTLDSYVKTASGGEAHLTRKMETVAIPVFQFGIFSDLDLSFHAGPNFNFGGRVHTNGNLFLAQGDGTTLTLPEKVTAVKEIIRKYLVNGQPVSVTNHEGTVKMADGSGTYRNLGLDEGSLTGDVNSSKNSSWPTISQSYYNYYIRNGTTGAKELDLPLITAGGANIDLVRRPPSTETASDTLFGERYFSKASLRILLSDTAADITGLPTVTSDAPVQLDGNWTTTAPAGYTVDATHPPIARSPGLTTATLTNNTSSGSNKSIQVNVMPTMFKIPTLSTMAGLIPLTVTCTGRDATATHFTSCSADIPALTVSSGTAITASISTVNGNVTVSTTLTASWTSPLIGTSNIAVADTGAFAPRTFWVENGSGSNVLVTCTGYDNAPEFIGCQVNSSLSNGATVTTAAASSAGTGLIGGYIKIERQNSDNTWTDVTTEILNYGIGAANQAGRACGDPTPDAIIRIQRLRDNADPAAGTCTYAGSTKAEDYWPQALFDTREGLQWDVNPGTTGKVRLGGVMQYIALDVANLSKWFQGTGDFAGGTGTQSLYSDGYSVYFSDRRNNRDQTNAETGEYGFEDVVNPTSNGAPNGTLDTGEDSNANSALDTYGQYPSYNGTASSAPPGATNGLDTTARPTTDIRADVAQVNRGILFRRALKLINGGVGNIVSPGLTIAAENPVYLQGDWNANSSSFSESHVATSIVADAVTLLSNNWTDQNSFANPYSPGSRTRSTNSYYRVAIISGKNVPFPYPTGAPATDFGSDGGVHNFLRMLESGGTVYYKGAIANFFYSRQAVGVYKGGNTIYGAPTRNFSFDTDFLDIAKLPPLTPVFRDLNSLGFVQEIRPGK
ncbi:MAG TPA: pilus assembly PilX N-terminal domain-containing protein [Vicinamibacterales bacterium]|nr:pilus assembly PilX N-terminal domain-containing protein [Vicinamibacterales bacterium]